MMLVPVAILLAVSACSHAGGQQQTFAWSPRDESLSADDFLTVTRGGPNRNASQKSFKTVRLLTSTSKRSSPRGSRVLDWRLQKNRPDQRRSPGRFDETSFKGPFLRPYFASIKRNDIDGSPQIPSSERYVRNVSPKGGAVAIPLDDSEKAASKGSNQFSRNIQNFILNTDKFVKFPPRPSDPDAQDTRADSSLTAYASIGNPLFPPPKDVPQVVYRLNPDPLVPAVILTDDPKPYDFGYAISDGVGSSQFRHESTAGDGVVTGNYGYKDYQGIYRHVNYVADKDGFRAVMRSNEPSVVPADSADVSVIVDPPPNVIIATPKKYVGNSVF